MYHRRCKFENRNSLGKPADQCPFKLVSSAALFQIKFQCKIKLLPLIELIFRVDGTPTTSSKVYPKKHSVLQLLKFSTSHLHARIFTFWTIFCKIRHVNGIFYLKYVSMLLEVFQQFKKKIQGCHRRPAVNIPFQI